MSQNTQLTIIDSFEGHSFTFQADDAYMNMTEMCLNHGKRPSAFLQLQSTKDFVAALEKLNNRIPVIRTTSGSGGKTLVHPDLALECARWIKPEFAIWCNQRIREILKGEKTLVYSTPNPMGNFIVPQDLPSALRLAADLYDQKMLAEQSVAAHQLVTQELHTKVEEARPKVEFYDTVTASADSMSLNETAKLLGIGPNRMTKQLREMRIFMQGKGNIPYMKHIDAGYFEVIEREYRYPITGIVHVSSTTRVFQKGVDFIRRELNREKEQARLALE